MDKPTHMLVDRTATALIDFSNQILKLASLLPGASCILVFAYDDETTVSSIEVISNVERDNGGVYYLNSVEIGDLDQTIQIYSILCAEVIKSIAADEKREDDFEELTEAPLTNNNAELQAYSELFPNEEQSACPDDKDDDNDGEIIENYRFD